METVVMMGSRLRIAAVSAAVLAASLAAAGATQLSTASARTSQPATTVRLSLHGSAAKGTPTTLPGKWKPIFTDSFSGTTLNPKIWQPGWFGTGVTTSLNTNDRACDSSKQVRVSGGLLRITAKRKSIDCNGKIRSYVSGVVSSNPVALGAGKGFQFKYGLIEFRARIPGDGKGHCADWAALWTNGQQWPVDGEIDAFECLQSASMFNLHSGPRGGAPSPVDTTPKGSWTGWHTFAVDWEPHSATAYFDGKKIGTHRYSVPHPNYIVMSNAIRVGSKIVLPTTLEVDWVKVFQHSSAAGAKRLKVLRPRVTLEAPAVPTISVVICAFTMARWHDLQSAVASVADQPLPAQIVIVIDHNDDLLAQARHAFRDATVTASVEQPGLSGARNTGITQATGSIVAFLDDDAAAAPDWLQRLTAHYAEREVMGVGGTAVPVWERDEPTWFPAEFRWVVGCSYVGLPTEVAPVRNFIGANMSYRRSVFDAVGGFASSLGRVGSLPAGCEETELGIRARHAFPGSRFVYDPAAQVHHRVGAERMSWGYFRRRCWAEGRSKAIVSRIAGSDAALESERRYVRRTLPAAVVAGLRSGPSSGGWSRAGAVVAGLIITTVGYGYGRLSPAAR